MMGGGYVNIISAPCDRHCSRSYCWCVDLAPLILHWSLCPIPQSPANWVQVLLMGLCKEDSHKQRRINVVPHRGVRHEARVIRLHDPTWGTRRQASYFQKLSHPQTFDPFFRFAHGTKNKKTSAKGWLDVAIGRDLNERSLWERIFILSLSFCQLLSTPDVATSTCICNATFLQALFCSRSDTCVFSLTFMLAM